MARRNSSYQDLFLQSLDGLGRTAMGAGQMVGQHNRAEAENTRQQAEETRRGEEHKTRMPGLKAEADSKSLDYDKALRQENITKSMMGGLEAHKADPLYADAQLASLTLGRQVTPEELRTQRGREEKMKGLEVESAEFGLGEKKNKAGRDAEAHRSGLQTDEAQRGLIGAQTEKTRADAAKAEREKPYQGIKLTEGQSKVIGAAATAKQMLDEIATEFKEGKLGGAGGFAADVVESVPLVGGKLAPKTNAYNDKRRITAETFLREATGAAAPAEEVRLYTKMLPEPGDSET